MLVCCWINIQSLYASYLTTELAENQANVYTMDGQRSVKATAIPQSGVCPIKSHLINTYM